MAQERRALALDLPGFGRSEMPRHHISISSFARCVNQFCAQLGLDEVVLVGNSMGGFVSAETAIQYPSRVERLVLVSAAGISITNLYRRPAQTWGRASRHPRRLRGGEQLCGDRTPGASGTWRSAS